MIRLALFPLQCFIALLSLSAQFGRRFCAELDQQCGVAMRWMSKR